MLHSRDGDENVLGVCVVCASQAHVARAWTNGLLQPRRPHRPGALPVIVQSGEGCIRGSVGGCLADPSPPPPPPTCSAFCGGPKVDWCVLDSTPSLRNHLALSRCVPCLMKKWAAHQRSIKAQLIMKLRLYPGCTPLCSILNHSLTLSPYSVSTQVYHGSSIAFGSVGCH